MPTKLSADDLREITDRLTAEADALREELSDAESKMPALYADCDLDAADVGARVTALAALRADADRARKLLDRVLAALPKVGTPGFGRCTTCGDVIGRDRLLAVPHTEVCIGCARSGAGAQV
ncbi:TraR/DksA C4-type zinc finger protein [Streptomyces sp. TP-A0356]|uniref:TraR/DksA family transcriptional regulator n=1 Tax=Streptomyces sp. TP-A0356 TaxID=1359208 RepID=UPI0006E293B7|nr:TraR/DksA C4-type zinc finger protein [Streptomyces sp. TP-A0356]